MKWQWYKYGLIEELNEDKENWYYALVPKYQTNVKDYLFYEGYLTVFGDEYVGLEKLKIQKTSDVPKSFLKDELQATYKDSKEITSKLEWLEDMYLENEYNEKELI